MAIIFAIYMTLALGNVAERSEQDFELMNLDWVIVTLSNYAAHHCIGMCMLIYYNSSH